MPTGSPPWRASATVQRAEPQPTSSTDRLATSPRICSWASGQAQILELLVELTRESGTALLLVTHDLPVVSEICERRRQCCRCSTAFAAVARGEC
ncbi:MAG: hypothetical protein ACRDRK_22955 [Pseudonocardia sp.]